MMTIRFTNSVVRRWAAVLSLLTSLRTSVRYRPSISTSPGASAACVDLPPEIQALVPGYLEGRRRDVHALEAAVVCGQFDLVARLGHNMKGTGTSYGFQEISDLGRELELEARSQAALEIRDSILHLGDCLDRIGTGLSDNRRHSVNR